MAPEQSATESEKRESSDATVREFLQRAMAAADLHAGGMCTCSQVAQLSDHAARLRSLETTREEDAEGWRTGIARIEAKLDEKFDRLVFWFLGALATSILSLVGLLISLLRK
jgi:hypothetical protein